MGGAVAPEANDHESIVAGHYHYCGGPQAIIAVVIFRGWPFVGQFLELDVET